MGRPDHTKSRAEGERAQGGPNLHALRGVCLRSFPEFLADLKLAGMGKGGEIGTGCADFTITVRPPQSYKCYPHFFPI